MAIYAILLPAGPEGHAGGKPPGPPPAGKVPPQVRKSSADESC